MPRQHGLGGELGLVVDVGLTAAITVGIQDLGIYNSRSNRARFAGEPQVQFIGGEPTLHPSLPALIDRARPWG